VLIEWLFWIFISMDFIGGIKFLLRRVWKTIPRGLYYILTIQHVQLNLIVQVIRAPHSTYIAQLDRSGHMSSTYNMPSSSW